MEYHRDLMGLTLWEANIAGYVELPQGIMMLLNNHNCIGFKNCGICWS